MRRVSSLIHHWYNFGIFTTTRMNRAAMSRLTSTTVRGS